MVWHVMLAFSIQPHRPVSMAVLVIIALKKLHAVLYLTEMSCKLLTNFISVLTLTSSHLLTGKPLNQCKLVVCAAMK